MLMNWSKIDLETLKFPLGLTEVVYTQLAQFRQERGQLQGLQGRFQVGHGAMAGSSL